MSNGLAVLIAGLVERAAGLLQDRVVRIALVGLDPDRDRALVDEAREVVDVAVGVVALDAFAEPDDVLLPVVVAQVFLDALLRQALGLRFLFSRHDVVVSTVPAPLKSTAPPSMTMPGIEHRQLQLLGDPRRHRVVGIPRRILAAPRVEAPVDDRRFGLAAPLPQHERRAVIARPALRWSGCDGRTRAAAGLRASVQELADDALVVVVGDVEMHFLARARGRGSGRRCLRWLRDTCRETRSLPAAASEIQVPRCGCHSAGNENPCRPAFPCSVCAICAFCGTSR